jgi:Fibronectin type III domain/FG-GAP-like repeat
MKSARPNRLFATTLFIVIVTCAVLAALFVNVIGTAQKSRAIVQISPPVERVTTSPVVTQSLTTAVAQQADRASVRVAPTVDLNTNKPVETTPAVTDRSTSVRGATQQDAPVIDNASNYGFTTATNGSFTDMSTGTTQLVAAGADDTASVVTNLGFDFYFLGTRYNQFSASSNGYLRLGSTAVAGNQYVLGTAAVPLITAMGSDMIVSTSGKVHYKVTGSAPNRVLTVEWLNMTIIYDGVGTAANGTYQVRLKETSGVVELVYGSMARGSGTGFGGANNPQYIGFSINSTATNFASIDTANNNSTATLAANQFPLSANMTSLNSPGGDGNRRIYTYTPPVPTAPTSMNFTAVTQTTMTVNWTDSPDETLYAIYNSTDGTNYSFVNTAAQNATSFAASGLNPSTTYFWQVCAVSDGALSTALSGSQATTAPGTVMSTAIGGNWSLATTWAGGVVPTAGDNVTIVDGATVTIDTAAVALNVTVGQGATGILQWETVANRTLTVGQAVTIASGGTFKTGAVGTVNTHVLSVGTDLTNNGTLDFSTTGTSANSCRAGITFTGANNNTFGGTGGTTDISTLTINKGTSFSSILELNPTNFTVQGASTAVATFVTLTNGTLKVSGTFTFNSVVFTPAAYSIGATAGFWLNNPNFTVNGQGGSPTVSGLLRISSGTFNIGTGTGNSMGFNSGSTITVEGGAVNATGRFGVASATNAITYTQSGGTITVCTIGNASASLGSFDLGTSASSNISISGGTVVVQLASTGTTQIDYRYDSGGSLSNLTGGTVQFGNAASGAAKSYSARGVAFNYVVNTTSAGHTVNLSTTLATWNHVAFGITVGAGGTFGCGNSIFFIEGNVVNNGTLTATGASVRLYNSAPGAQTYSGTGTFTAPITSFELDNLNGLTLSTTNQIPTLRVILFNGGITGAGKLTLGNGGATAGTFQIGNTTTPTAAGTLDAAPTFNLGTGGEVINYLRTTTDRNTGPEIQPSRSITTLSVDPNGINVNLAGGDLTVTGTTTITTGNFVIGANTLAITNAIAGALPTGLLGGATSSLILNGTVASNVPSSITQLNNFTLNNSGGSTQQVANLTINGDLTLSSGAYSIGANRLKTRGLINTTAGGLTGGALSNMEIGGTGAAVTLPAVSGGLQQLELIRPSTINLGAPLSIGGAQPGLVLFAGTLNNSTNNVTLADLTFFRRDNGSITAAPIFTNRVDLAYFSGSTGTSGPEMPTSSSAIHILESNWANLTLATNATVNLQLILDAGIISTGGNVLTLNTGATVLRTSGWVNGNYARVFQTNLPFTYDVGDTLNYSPVVVTPSAGSYPTTLTVRATAAPIAGLVSSQSLQRQWSLSPSGIIRATLDLNYVPADIPGGANTAQWRVVRKLTNDQRFTFPNGFIDNVNEGTGIGSASGITMPAFGGVFSVTQTNAPAVLVGGARPVETFDYQGNDSRTDVSIWDGTSGVWTFVNSSNDVQTSSNPWGSTALGDHIVPGDYDGDGIADLAVWRDTDFNWFIFRSSNGLGQAINWGASGDKTVPGDYDGDGKTDVAVFRPSEGNWYILRSSDNGVVVRNWGAASDYLVPADYDGDGKTDVAVFRPSEGNWYVVKSSDSSVVIRSWGAAGDSIVPGDYDGDGKADFAIFRPSDGAWYVINSADSSVTVRHWGASTDTLVPGDYDRDGRIDLAVYRPSEGNWYIINSGDGTLTLRNLTGGTIVPAAYVQP